MTHGEVLAPPALMGGRRRSSVRGEAGRALLAEIARQGRDVGQLALVLGVSRKHLVRALGDRGQTRLLDLVAEELGVRLVVTATSIAYGPCEVCGAPRKSVMHERENGITVMGLVCSADPTHGPDHPEVTP